MAQFFLCQKWPAALPARLAEAEIQRIEIDARKLLVFEFTLGDDLLPIVGIGRMADSIVLVAHIGEVRRTGVAA